MRQIGSLVDEERAQVFADFLVTQGIAAHAEPEEDAWAIWVRDENDVDRARTELSTYLDDPVAGRYRQVSQRARQLRQEQARQQRQASLRTVDMRRQWSQPMARRAPLVMFLIVLCVAAALSSGFGQRLDGVVMRDLSFCDPVRYQQSHDGLQQIRQGQLWRTVTPIFLHYGPIHLVFNLFWLYSLGTQIEARRGTWRLGWMILVIAVVSNLLQYFVGRSPMFFGISGVVYGLLGYIWMKKVFDPHAGFLLSDSTVLILLLFLVLGFVGAFDGLMGAGSGVANAAHVGGLAAGIAIGYVPIWWARRRG